MAVLTALDASPAHVAPRSPCTVMGQPTWVAGRGAARLRTDAFELRRDLQRQLGELDESHERFRSRVRATRLRWLTVLTLLLSLAIPMVLLDRM